MTRQYNSKNNIYKFINNPIIIWIIVLLCCSNQFRGMIATLLICSIIIDSGFENGIRLVLDILWKIFLVQSIYFFFSLIIEMTLLQFYYTRCYYPEDYLTNAECWLRSFPKKTLFW